MPIPKLGNRPKNFKRTVKFDLIDGGVGTIACTFKYRTRSEFGAFVDGAFGAGVSAGLQDEKFTFAKMLDRETEQHSDYLLQVLESWDLSDDLNAANAQRLADEFPGAVVAVMDSYRLAVTEGRLGN